MEHKLTQTQNPTKKVDLIFVNKDLATKKFSLNNQIL